MSDSDKVEVSDALPTAVPQTDPSQDPTQARIKDFLDAYGALVKEKEIDFASYPVYVPDGQGGFKTLVQNTPVDIRNQPKKSPFMQPAE